MQKVNAALQWLLEQDFVEEVEDNEGMYRLTSFGDSQLSTSHVSNSTTYSNISNSNTATNRKIPIKQLVLANCPKMYRKA
ncbi:MAG TPA: hypothetical protein VMB52_03410 [Verrucomicrobiae bacterium]|nr:hypothetical protein [Verrucomicrobiae bacterium]